MKRLLTLFFAFAIAFLISSCSTINRNKKYLIGTWKAEKVEKYNVPNRQIPAAGSQGKTKPGTGDTIASANTAEQSSRIEGKNARLIGADLKSTLTLNADKTTISEYHGKSVHGKWKLRKHGTRLLTNNKESGKKRTFDILHISDTSAVVTESFPFGRMKITYKKIKK